MCASYPASVTVSVTTWVPARRQPVAQRVRLLGGHERLAHHAHHAHAILLGPALEHAVEPVLLGQRVDHPRLRRLAPQMPHGPGSAASASSV